MRDGKLIAVDGLAPTVVELAVNSCPVCGDALGEVENGQNCKGCESRARLRSMAPLMPEYLAPLMRDNRAVELPLLAFAMTGAERKFLSTVFKSIKSVSLFGNYSTDHESGVDMRDLSRYPPDGFSGVFGCLLFDYFPEHEQALRECYRVIAPGGVFFTHIAPYRLVDGEMPPQQKGAIKSRAGYFEYLPDKTELPDVKVGRDWFLSAMERVGFKTALVRVRDAVPGLVSEWFIGIKPGAEATTKEKSLPVSNPSMSAPSNIDTRVSEVFRSIVPLGTAGQGVLTFELIEAQRGSLVFLEDCYLPALDGGGSIREVVATNGSRNQILVSRDLGKNWQPLYENVKWDDKIRWAFSLADGSRLIRTFSGRMYHLGAGGELVSEYSTGAWHWHGSQGIGQSNRGTVMYAEYAPLRDADGVQDLSVWRYRPWAPQDGWHRVLTLPAAVRPPQGELRHFHVCRPHPSAPSLWILASGDIGAHCRMWLGQDDGDHWQEVMLDQAELVGMTEGKYPRLLRFTQFAALDNGDLIWGTDDTSDVNRAALISLSLSTNRPVFRFLGWLGRNCIRNIASLGGDRYLLLSELKHDPVSADCILYNATTERVTPFLLPNLGQIQNPVTDSLGSLQMPNGVGFFPAQGAVLMHPDKRGIFRVSIEDLSQ
ncbi:class I SAM-dependent methyltransferase [Laribacter hongkongensis]|uniref:methyltransferase domain-containing protein n=1 Tax=Laribacter hongkongensis TaxID=168471 RepID=UPI001EFCC13B|nr:methyltransferase domain-containing protein [Laribacter hongkongensis]MCG9116345.1 class I SAM-dependent methyltransferase [Laribacter hongkongensis]